jgi:nicotinamidase-related amidase
MIAIRHWSTLDMTTESFLTSPSPAVAWTVHEDHVSLVRKPAPALIARVPALPAAVELDLTRCALVIVDMQNDFCHADGWFAGRGIDIAPMRRPITAIAALSNQMRDAGMRVVWLNWGIRADRANLPPGVLYRGKRKAGETGYGDQTANGSGPALVQGSWGAALIDELQAHPADLLVNKHRLSGFWDSEFDSVLRQAGITTLLFAGINIDRCVFSTLQDAGFLGYDCVVVEDACSTPSPQYVTDAILFLVRELHGFTTTHAQLATAVSTLVTKE